MMHGFGLGSFGWIGMIFNLLVFVGVIIGIIWLVKSLVSANQSPRNAQNSTGLSAREILDQRYARGEISRDEYDQMKADIAGG